MFLSIITVTKNNRHGLQATYESLHMQTAQDFEWVVIDGDSHDDTLAYLDGKNAHVLSEPDLGIYDAMNKGLARAHGTYVLFLNAGDTLAGPHVLAHIRAQAEKQYPHFIYGDGLEDNFYKKARSHKNLLWCMPTYHQAMFYKLDVIGLLRYDLRYPLAADYKFTIEFLRKAERILYWPYAICNFETGGVSQQKAWAVRRELAKIRKDTKLCNPLVNIMIVTAQSLIWALRRRAPRVYRYMRGRDRASA